MNYKKEVSCINKTMLKTIYSILVIMIAWCAVTPIDAIAQQENNPPVVKILDPINKSSYDLNAQVRYRVKVSDKEDGESEYDEIAANEVFLEVRYLLDVSKASMLSKVDPKALEAMKKSNCFNCHAFNGKLIAPSFYEISKRYPQNASNIERLAKRVLEGSTGVWGSASMPTHPELSVQEARDIVSWILENAQNPNLNYYTGTEGSIKLKLPDGAVQKGAFMLSATYSDHGIKNNPKQSLTSKDVILLYVK
jgi:cytochrome c